MKRGRENQEVGEQKVKEQTAIQREEKTDRTRTVEHATEQRSLKIYLKKKPLKFRIYITNGTADQRMEQAVNIGGCLL